MAIRGHPKSEQNGEITKDTPLTALEEKFVQYYIETSNAGLSCKKAGFAPRSDGAYRYLGCMLLKQPNVKERMRQIMEELRTDTIMTAQEVMEYFTAVARGQIKDQFGLEAPLSERTKAAQEIAKRTIDIQNAAEGKASQSININLNWKRESDTDN